MFEIYCSDLPLLLTLLVPPFLIAFGVLPRYLYDNGQNIHWSDYPLILVELICLFLILVIIWIGVVSFIQHKLIPAIRKFIVYDVLYYLYPRAQIAPVTSTYAFTQWQIDECNICLEKWRRGEYITILPCHHIYHSSCIKDYERSATTQFFSCPHCSNRYSNSNTRRIINTTDCYSHGGESYFEMEDFFDTHYN